MTTLVIVDGTGALREGLMELLARHGVDVVGSAANMPAALDAVAVADPDVALVDVRLPDGSGIELARQLLARRPDLRVVLYAGDADGAQLKEAQAAGAQGFVAKAGSVDELVMAIDRVGRGGTYVDPRLDGGRHAAVQAAGPPSLSAREREVLRLMAEGMTAEAIAGRLEGSVDTVRTHVRNAVRKLHARNRVHAVAVAIERGLIALEERRD